MGAEVKLTDRSTGSYQVQPSNQTGRFTFSSVKPGGYDVEVTMKGFRKLMVADQELVLGGQLTLNLTLEVGTSTQTVEVTCDARRRTANHELHHEHERDRRQPDPTPIYRS